MCSVIMCNNGILYLKSNAFTFSIREVRNCCTIVEKPSQKNTNIAPL